MTAFLRWPKLLAQAFGYKPTEGSGVFTDLLITVGGWALLIGALWFVGRRVTK